MTVTSRTVVGTSRALKGCADAGQHARHCNRRAAESKEPTVHHEWIGDEERQLIRD
jgi:hypothetical protein